MTATKTYSEKLRDPRWQRKRLEVMERDGFACKKCGDKAKTLNVHHRYYCRGYDPWSYPLTALVTLCETCHQEETERDGSDKIKEVFGILGLFEDDLDDFACDLYTLSFLEDTQESIRILGLIASDHDLMSLMKMFEPTRWMTRTIHKYLVEKLGILEQCFENGEGI